MSIVASILLAMCASLAAFLFGHSRANKGTRPAEGIPAIANSRLEQQKRDAINNTSGHSRERLERLLDRSEQIRKSLSGQTPK